jgi:ketosteroid isomerase-like protein
MDMTPEEQALRSYVESFNRHDIEAVMACFVDEPAILDMSGKRHEGRDQVRRFYELQFAFFPDGRCDIKAISGHGATGMAETAFHGTHAKTGRVISACGPEVVEFAGDKIKELLDYHRLTS